MRELERIPVKNGANMTKNLIILMTFYDKSKQKMGISMP